MTNYIVIFLLLFQRPLDPLQTFGHSETCMLHIAATWQVIYKGMLCAFDIKLQHHEFALFLPADITQQSEMSTIMEEPSNAADTSANTTRSSRRSERTMGEKSLSAKSPRPEPVPQLEPEPEPVPAPQDTFAQIPDGIVDNPADPTTIEPTIDPNLDLEGPPSVAPFSVPPPSNAPPSVGPPMAPVSLVLCILVFVLFAKEI